MDLEEVESRTNAQKTKAKKHQGRKKMMCQETATRV
jgi:hypothetical protein